MQGDVVTLLRELADFLDALSDVELPESLQTSRESLLDRSRSILENADSLQPYLDMNVQRGKTLDETDRPEEYVSADGKQDQRGSLHYYETFQEYDAKKEGQHKTQKRLDDETMMYAGWSAVQAKARSAKSGSLEHLRREGITFLEKFHFIWLRRQYWVSLVGTHLLLFPKEHDNQPSIVVPLKGYKSRALSNNNRRLEGAFEIYCPGERTFKFVAKSSEEMREWVNAITQSLEPNELKAKTRKPTFADILDLDSNEKMCKEAMREEAEKYQDVMSSPKVKPKEKKVPVKNATLEKEKPEKTKVEEAPPLPARTERRRLPSLPSQERLSLEPKEEIYDEEGLYHRIEDIKAQREYQNCKLGKGKSVELVQETYDDVEVFVDKSKVEVPMETYDDVGSILRNKEEPVSYDDVQTKAEKDKSPKPSKTRSFFERGANLLRNRKDSMKRDDRTPKSPIPKTPEPDMPCYDDVSSAREAQEENYLSPPPPRPIYSRPPTIIKCAAPEEIYDDIGAGGEVNGCKGCANVDVIRDCQKNDSFLSDLQLSGEQEHYQVPKSGNRPVESYQPPEELYDDVALSETFKNRPRETPEKSMWSRFGSGKRPKIFDQLTRQSSDDIDDNENQQARVRHSIQKLKNKVENSFGKTAKQNGVAQS